MVNRKKEFLTALAVVVIIYVVLGIPYALTAHTPLMSLKRLVVLAFLSGAMLILWILMYKQIADDFEKLREEIERKMRGHNESEHDDCTLD